MTMMTKILSNQWLRKISGALSGKISPTIAATLRIAPPGTPLETNSVLSTGGAETFQLSLPLLQPARHQLGAIKWAAVLGRLLRLAPKYT